jgi:hypothetical protein
MFKIAEGFLIGVMVVLGGLYVLVLSHRAPPSTVRVVTAADAEPETSFVPTEDIKTPAPASLTATSSTKASSSTPPSTPVNTPGGVHIYTYAELLALADNTYADGNVPLGDYKYVTDAPKKGYIYLCNVHKDNPGSMVSGPWMGTNTWNFLQKISIQGNVSWPNASFSNTISGVYRTLTGNDLPINHTTGSFPVSANDPAATYDKNPNSISAQTLNQKLPTEPTYSATPYCMGGEVGIMLSGVALFNGFDAGLRDAAAHELQDSCEGHPQGSGEYHYHSLSSCFKEISNDTVLGFAYDGYPITGPKVADNKYLTTEDLDECHGLTSEITVDGKKKTTYHYVMTQDFPYSASCFRAKPVTTGPSAGSPAGGGQIGQQGMMPPPPPR